MRRNSVFDLFGAPKAKENGGTKWDLDEKLDRKVKKLLPCYVRSNGGIIAARYNDER